MMPWDDAVLSQPQKALRAAVRSVARARADYPVLGRGQRETLYVDDDVWLYRRNAFAAWPSVLVALNRAEAPRRLQLPTGNYEDILSHESVSGAVELAARGYALLEARP